MRGAAGAINMVKVEDFGETTRFIERFATIPTGYAFRANDGDVRPLSETEATAALAEGTAAIRHAAQFLQYGSWAILALTVIGVAAQNGGGVGVFSSKMIVMWWSPFLHVLSLLHFQWRVRRVPEELSERVRNRIALSPALVGPMLRRNWFKVMRATLAICTVAYMLWIVFTITGSFSPESLGAGVIVIDGHSGQTRVIGGGANPADEMSRFAAHMPEILALIALCYAVYFAEWLTDKSIRREVERIRQQRPLG